MDYLQALMQLITHIIDNPDQWKLALKVCIGAVWFVRKIIPVIKARFQGPRRGRHRAD